MVSTNQLRHEAKQKHEADDGRESYALAVMQVRKVGPALGHGAGEDFLNHGENHGRRDEQAEDRDRGRNPGERKNAAEDEELADEAVEAGQAERRKERDAHESGEDRRGLAQAAEIVDAAQTAGAELDHGDEPEERGGGDAVIEHLQDDAVERGGLAGLLRRAGRRNGQREDAEQAVAEVVDRGVGEDALQIFLRGGSPCAHDDGGDRENQQRRAHLRRSARRRSAARCAAGRRRPSSTWRR